MSVLFLTSTRGSKTKLEPVWTEMEDYKVEVLTDPLLLPQAKIKPEDIAKESSNIMYSLAESLAFKQPECVVVIGDRWETLAAAACATFMHVPIVHLEGGEVSGGIDEAIRHSITQLSHLHLTATEEAAQRVIALGQDPATVFNVGATSLDSLVKHKDSSAPEGDPYFLVIWHSTYGMDYIKSHREIKQALNYFKDFGEIWISSNPEAGADGETAGRGYPAHQFGPLLANASCVVGNSSVGVRESAFFGVPSVNIGDRQQGRYRPRNVVDVKCNEADIKEGIRSQIGKRYPREDTFGDGTAGKKAAKIIKEFELKFQKRITL